MQGLIDVIFSLILFKKDNLFRENYCYLLHLRINRQTLLSTLCKTNDTMCVVLVRSHILTFIDRNGTFINIIVMVFN